MLMSRSYVKDRFERSSPSLSDNLVEYWEQLILKFAAAFGASNNFESYLSENIVSKINNPKKFFRIDHIYNPFTIQDPNSFSYCNFMMDDKNKFLSAEFVTKYPLRKMDVSSKFDKKIKLLEYSLNYYIPNVDNIVKTKKMLCPLHEEVLLFKVFFNNSNEFIRDILPSAVEPSVFDYSTPVFSDIIDTLEMTFL